MQFWRLSARAAPRRTYTRLRATRSYTQGPAQGPARKPFVILACDGGGCRGFLSIKLIERLDAAVPDFLDRVDMFAGTSTGSVIAAMLASGATPSEVAANYEEWCPAIFAQPRSLIRRAFAAKFSNKPLRGALDEFFGDLRVTQLPRRFLCPALRVDGEASATTSAEVWRLSASRAARDHSPGKRVAAPPRPRRG